MCRELGGHRIDECQVLAAVRLPVCAWPKFEDAARAIVELAAAPRDRIQAVTYVLAGIVPVPSAGELVASVRTRLPGARIEFRPDPALQGLMDAMARPLADGSARTEWGWQPRYGLEEMVDDFLRELRLHPKRYSPAGGAS